MLELYGDQGNIQVLRYRLEQRGIHCTIDTYSIGDKRPNFKSYDMIFAGGGADNEQGILSKDLIQYKEEIQEAEKEGVFFLLICGAYQLFGKYYKNIHGHIIPGLEIFPYYTESSEKEKKRYIGDIILSVNLNGQETKIIGFENHSGQTYDIPSPFGKILFRKAHQFSDTEEGFFKENVIATYLHGPLLSKNPKLADYIIKHCLDKKYQEDTILKPLNDTFENLCRKQLLHKFLNMNHDN